MANKPDRLATHKVKKDNLFLTAAAGASCGFLFFLLSFKLGAALAFAVRWIGPHELVSFNIMQILQASSFAVAWSIWVWKKPTPREAMLWQTLLYLVEWGLLFALASFLTQKIPELRFLTRTFVIFAFVGALSGFVTGWALPYILKWLIRSTRRTPPSSFSAPPKDTTYEIQG